MIGLPTSRRGFLAGALALALPARALGLVRAAEDPVRFHARDEPLAGERAVAAGPRVLDPVPAPLFNLLGLHWRGDGRVWARVASAAGPWGDWLQVEPEGRPDDGSPESRARAGWTLGGPLWTEAAERVQYRVEGEVESLRANFVWSPPRPARRLVSVGGPDVLERASWYANDSILRGRPVYADRVRYAVIHHTAGRRPVSPLESPALVRAIEEYHVKGNGWSGLGYNFLVDPYGYVYEGRRGGVARPVVGAHAKGFNIGSCGIALLGNYETDELTPEARTALARLLAWRLDLSHVDPLSLVGVLPTGNGRFPGGSPVTARAVSGHRDVDWTACPGSNFYAQLGSLIRESAAIGLPKLFDPRVEGAIGGPVRFLARLSEPRRWRVRVRDRTGRVVARAAGRGSRIAWTWDATGAEPGRHSYTIGAGSSVRPASGSVGPDGPEPATDPVMPPRPGSVPRRIPAWAWRLHDWHSAPAGSRGPRPETPSPLPRWYWEWHVWRAESARLA